MKRYGYGAGLFAGFALLGPTVVSFHSWAGLSLNDFLYDLVAQIWPFWLVAQYESVMGTFNAVILGTVLNVVVFGALGLVASAFAHSKQGLVLVFLFACVVQYLWFIVGAGTSSPGMLPYLSLAIACLLIAVPLVALARIYSTSEAA
jgi:hypothetical protein